MAFFYHQGRIAINTKGKSKSRHKNMPSLRVRNSTRLLVSCPYVTHQKLNHQRPISISIIPPHVHSSPLAEPSTFRLNQREDGRSHLHQIPLRRSTLVLVMPKICSVYYIVVKEMKTILEKRLEIIDSPGEGPLSKSLVLSF